jgi:hypothetical protein
VDRSLKAIEDPRALSAVGGKRRQREEAVDRLLDVYVLDAAAHLVQRAYEHAILVEEGVVAARHDRRGREAAERGTAQWRDAPFTQQRRPRVRIHAKVARVEKGARASWQ